eukprot:TRINITY_DN2309_c1_g1_i3.p1 TRINITY_DN2309_c1_g1~~TRINITY_DN2309_c1_g1_i3.p1  ORF type:complete len:226 (-),score=27.58 TRINITY_DN2309_c1_g1_i3:73-750(-)
MDGNLMFGDNCVDNGNSNSSSSSSSSSLFELYDMDNEQQHGQKQQLSKLYQILLQQMQQQNNNIINYKADTFGQLGQNNVYEDQEILNQMRDFQLEQLQSGQCEQQQQYAAFIDAVVHANVDKPLPKYIQKYKYAHSVLELRPQKYHVKYKSVPCNKFVRGYCPFGRRCTFTHPAADYKSYIVVRNEDNNTPVDCVPYLTANQPPHQSVLYLLKQGILPQKTKHK